MYGWSRVHINGSKGISNLNSFWINEINCYLDVCKVTLSEHFIKNLTGYILSGVTEGLFIMVLEDTSGGHSHTIRINRGFNVIYDFMKTHELYLNQ